MMGGICDRCRRDRRSTSPFSREEDIWLCSECREHVVTRIRTYSERHR